jgi:hypothetical protein
MDFLEIANELADELDLDQITTLEGTGVSDEVRRIRKHINHAYNYVWLKLNPKNEYAETETSFTTTANQAYVSIPVGILGVDMVWFGNDPPLKLIPPKEFKYNTSQVITVTDTGYPTSASIYQRRIYFYPVPDSAYAGSLRGKGGFTDLTLDEDEPLLDSSLHRVIVQWALYFQMKYENNPALQEQSSVAQDALTTARNQMRIHGAEEAPCVMHERDIDRIEFQNRVVQS